MLALAACEADIVGLLPSMSAPGGGFGEYEVSLEAFATIVAFIRNIAGKRFAAIELNILIQTLRVADDRNAAIDALRSDHEITDDAWFDSPIVYVGSVEEIASRMRAVRKWLGVSCFLVFEPFLEKFAPVVAALTGR